MNKLCTLGIFFTMLLAPAMFLAQPSNDECINAIELDDVSDWCSAIGEFTNAGATLSAPANPSCFPDDQHDVWFSFVAQAKTLHVTLIGNTAGPQTPGGTLTNPQFAVYSGTCNNLTEVQCASDAFGNNLAETFAGPLIIGQTYFIRIDARNGQTGTFRLCVNNFNPVAEPDGDCPTGSILCDKSSFTVESLVGTGNLQNEFNPGICINTEFASSWYRWTCKDPGTLTFTITPTNPADDIDFALFELPGGIDDCANKVKIRCEAAGENVGAPFSEWEICTGPTGLSTAESDTDEAPGCNGGNNNFVAAVDMIAGRSYALIINNFSNTGNGFSIEFGGTGTFLGPDADFNVAPQVICQGADITFSDLSNSVGGIDEWEWSFGIGADPATATGKGPHTVSYNTPGIKSIALTVTDKSGCIVTHVETITVLPPPNVDPEIISDYCGPDDATGGISLTPTGDATPYTYNWQGSGTFSPDNTLENIQQGSYSVIVKDANGCSKPFNFVVPEGLSLAAGLDPVTEPTCNGDSDGSISVSIEIANYPVTYDFGNGPQSDSVLSNIPAGTYTVHVVDNAGCEGTFNIVVNEFPPLLLGIDPLDISCYGAVDGSIDANPTGGAGGYTYLWSNGELTNPITDLNVGTYTVTVTDANGCRATATADIIEPPALELTLDITDVICHGDATGVVTMNAVGGTPPFEFSSNGVDFQSDPELGGLVAGVYEVVLRDSRGCTFTLEAEIDQPAPLVVEAGPNQTIDLGYSAEIKTVVTPLFRPVVLSWSPGESLDCDDCFNPTASPFLSTTYYVTATDETNCIALDSVTINVLLNRPIYIPNVFSPNGDGLNDFFIAFGGPAARRILQIKIFDRWGELVYDGRDLPLNEESLGWDGTFKGKVLNPAVFVYFAEIEFIDGAKVIYEGGVTILK